MYETDSSEQAALRETIRDFCRQHADATAWKRLTGELGLTALAVDERYDGMGATFAEVAIAAEELGRVLLPVPYLSTALAGAVLSDGDRAAAEAFLPGIVSGAMTAAFIFGGIAATDGRLDGTARHVLDGAAAGVFLVRVQDVLYTVRAQDTIVEAVGTLDQTRFQATVTFQGAPTLVVGPDDGRAENLMRVLIAAESAAAAVHCLDSTVAYLKARRQFGRPIGSFQALKHRCADLAVGVASARAAAHAAVSSAVAGTADLAVMAPLAKLYCTDIFWRAAAEMVQLHGGIGFTWEHEAHRYLKRAKTSQLLLGAPSELRRLVADVAGLR
ncbi:acyl-CoA dehydrogenase [Trebonia kvetii]|uniref:Acyl-CoA dehydrogenase n=1 Tax=Trebonia kvetii TaxID=2480626 RepID=A0A6P2BV89_9ACTN|nr:acyl-CoA dehydrogenase family protein [Trebonia kvetii]TVZ02146.1 acyl-CoA dehydrogenase [Trebonia kvetii]